MLYAPYILNFILFEPEQANSFEKVLLPLFLLIERGSNEVWHGPLVGRPHVLDEVVGEQILVAAEDLLF